MVINKKQIISSIFVVAALCSTISTFSMDIFDIINKGDVKEVKRLITEQEIDVNKTENKKKVLPLAIACGYKNPKIVRLILPHCTNKTINKTINLIYGNKFFDIIRWLCYKKHSDILKKMLLKCTEETINKVIIKKKTIVRSICKFNNFEIVKLFLPKIIKNKNILFYACKFDRLEIVKLLLENGIDCYKGKAFYIARKNNNLKIMKLLLKQDFINNLHNKRKSLSCPAVSSGFVNCIVYTEKKEKEKLSKEAYMKQLKEKQEYFQKYFVELMKTLKKQKDFFKFLNEKFDDAGQKEDIHLVKLNIAKTKIKIEEVKLEIHILNKKSKTTLL